MIMDGKQHLGGVQAVRSEPVQQEQPGGGQQQTGHHSGRGPTLGSRLAASPSVRMMPAEEGRNAKPARSGVYP
jgi:hypothetical protein